MKMTERYGSPGGGSVGGSGSNRKHKKYKTVVNSNNSASSTLPTILTKSSSLNNNGNNFDDNFLTTESSFTINGQQQQQQQPSSSKSLCENVPKSLKLVLKVGQSGSYSPAPASTITTSSFLNNSKTQIINNIENNNYNIDSINQTGDSSSTHHHDRSQTKIQPSPPVAPPELLPLNVDSYHNNVDFIPINNSFKKVKKKKKKHHHHHHHSHGHHHSKSSSTSTNNIDNVTTIKTTTFMKLNNHLSEIIKNSSDSSIHNNNNSNSGNSIDNIVNNSSSSSNNNDNSFVNMKNKNSQCSSTDAIYAFDNPQQQKPLIPMEESTSNAEQTNENLQLSSEGIKSIDDSSISVWPAVSNNNNNVDNELLDVNENDVVEDEDGMIMGSMLFKQDSIFSSVDLMDIDSCSKLDISALVPEGDELNDDVSQQSSLMSQYQLNQRPRAKLRPTSSIYRQLLQKGQVRCDSNNIYEHLRRQEKMSNDSKTISSLMKFPKPSPFQQFLISLLNKVQSEDVYKLFAWPVIDSLTPGYSKFVCHPMDFHTIQKKIEHNLYRSVAEMKYDVRILCENAMSYYRRSGLHYKEASKLWFYAKTKVFARNQLAEHVKQFPPLTMTDLGMDDLSKINSSTVNIESTTANEMETQSICNKSLSQQTTTLQALLSDSKCEPNNNKSVLPENGYSNDDYLLEPTAEQILEDIKKSFIKSGLDSSNVDLSKLTSNLPQNDEVKLTRLKPDGTTTLPFVLPDSCYHNEQAEEINLGHLVGRLSEGTPALESYKEPIVNRIKPCHYIEEMLVNPFSTHLPYMDSGSSTINHQDTALLFETFEKYQPSKHSEEIERVANDESYLMKSFVDSLLVTVSKGDYKPDKMELCNGTKHDCHDDETNQQTSINPIQKRLNETKDFLERLEKLQKQRLCKTTEPIGPTNDETEMAGKVTTSLTDIIKCWFQPSDVIDQKTLHKHLGIDIKIENGNQQQPSQSIESSETTETFSNLNNNL